ncbi:DUF2523 family protein [Stenotrophomonas terrae]|uniref:DUF2523 family protein n=1 Tax=Stenotrophomonas terrae TaxID=405446 RepID=UPI00320B340B
MWETAKTLLVGYAGHVLTLLKAAAGFIVARVLAAFGLTWVTYVQVLPEVKDFVRGYTSALSSEVAQLIGAMGIDIFVIMILSACVAKYGMRAFLVGIEQLQTMIGNAGG